MSNLLTNSDAATGTMEGWTHTNVTVQENGIGDYFFQLSSDAVMYQSVEHFPEFLMYDDFKVHARFRFTELPEITDILVRLYIVVTINYEEGQQDIFIFCPQHAFYDEVEGWFEFNHTVPLRMGDNIAYVTFFVNTEELPEHVEIDELKFIAEPTPVQESVSSLEERVELMILYGLDKDKPPLGVK